MSHTYTARVVCGFPLEIEPVKRKKTKYDENTGDPYEIEEHSHFEAVVGYKVVKDDIDDEYGDIEIDGMEVFSSNNGDDRYLGIEMAGVASDDDYEDGFHPTTPDEVVVFSQKHNIQPEWFLILDCF